MRTLALCAGYGGLELGLELAGLAPELVAYAETDPHASKVMARHWPDVPNLGDITELHDPPEADAVAAGFPCGPVSVAGQRKGTEDERWLIHDVVRVWRRSGARWLFLENVPGLYHAQQGRAFEEVIDALAEVGAAARWTRLRASAVGACHRRERWFCVAANADGEHVDWPRPTGQARRHESTDCRPRPTIDGQLSPKFVEWLMMLPDGWVTDTPGISRTQALRILGNGVVPQQAAMAYQLLTQHEVTQ